MNFENWLIILALASVPFVIIMRKNKRWLGYYLLGAFSLVIFLVFGIRALGFEEVITTFEGRQVSLIAKSIGIENIFFAPRNLQVSNPVGWTLVAITIECSAILESSVLVALILFYPAFNWQRKLFTIIIGITGTYLINLARVIIIMGLINTYGNSIVFLAHALIGRMFFFGFVVALYWWIITKPTLWWLGRKLMGAGAANV